MMESTGRPRGRFFCFWLFFVLVGILAVPNRLFAAIPKTSVNDLLYRADGSPARGTVTIRWNGFTASDGSSVAAGVLAVKIGTNGSFAVQLVPNTGAKPEGSYYKVVMKLDDGTTSEEAWAVPAAPTTTVAAVRATVMPTSSAVQYVGRDYVDTAVAATAANNVQTGGNYADPVWLSSLSSSKLVGTLPAAVLPATMASTNSQNTFTQPQTFANINGCRYAGQIGAGTIQAAIDDAGTNGCVIIPKSYSGTDVFTNPNSIAIVDYRRGESILNVIDVRDYGAKCDGATDDTAALQSAIAAAGSKGGEILINGNGSSCYLAKPQSISWPTLYSALKIRLKGTLKVGTTFTVPDSVDLIGDGGGGYNQFLGIGPTASVLGPGITGTLGTSFGAGTQTFTPSSMNGIYPGTGLTVAGTITCSISSIARSANVVTATLGGSCRVPPGASLTVAGVSDAGYNGTFFVTGSDYGLNTITWNQSGSNSSSAGGNVTGLNEDSIETVLVTATTGTTATATFLRAHNAADQFGVVVVATKAASYLHKSLQNISVSGCGGACIWLNNSFYWGMFNVGATAAQTMTSVPLVLSTASGGVIERGSFLAATGFPSPGMPWGVHLTEVPNVSGDTTGNIEISNAYITRGVKIDNGNRSNMPQMASNITIRRTMLERVASGVRLDPRGAANIGVLNLDSNFVQDNLDGFAKPCLLYGTDYGNGKGGAIIRHTDATLTNCIVGGYFDGSVSHEGAPPKSRQTAVVPTGTVNTGRQLEAELRGVAAGFGPSLVPYATANLPDVAAWTSGTCSVAQGQLAPDGSTGAVALSYNSGYWMDIGSGTYTTNTGDYFLYGAWIKPGSDMTTRVALGGDGRPFYLRSSGANDLFEDAPIAQEHYPSNFMSQVEGDWWTPVVAIARLKQADGGSHAYGFRAECPASGNGSLQFWGAFMMRIPATVPLEEVQRIRQQLLHGYVPPNMPGGQVLAMHPSHKIYFGSDTYISRTGAGSIGVNGTTINAVTFQTNGMSNASQKALNLQAGSNVSLTNTSDGTVKIDSTSMGAAVATVAPALQSGTGSMYQGLYTPSSAGLFRACGFTGITVAGTGGNFSLQLNYVQDGHAQNSTTFAQSNVASQWSAGQGCVIFYNDANQLIHWNLISSATGSPTVRYALTLERLQ